MKKSKPIEKVFPKFHAITGAESYWSVCVYVQDTDFSGIVIKDTHPCTHIYPTLPITCRTPALQIFTGEN